MAINTAGAGELDGLYGIGPALAARIVAVREQKGPFRGPDDLAEVEGVGRDLAYVLAPHIDWSHPVQEEVGGKSWPEVFAGSILAAVCLASLVDRLQKMPATIRSGRWYDIWDQSMALLLTASEAGAIVCLTLAMWSRSRIRAAGYIRTGVYFLGGCAFALLNLGLSIVVWLTFEAPGGWNFLIGSPALLLGLSMSTLGAACCCSAIIVAFKPQYVQSRLLAAVVNTSILLWAPATAGGTWVLREELPLWMRYLGGLGGVCCIIFGVDVIRGVSFLQIWSRHLGIIRNDGSTSLWVRWINLRLPDPEQQKALLDALQQVHPPSRWRTFRGVLITGAGAWLLAATASAIWEWLVQNWLDSGFGAP